MNTRNLVNVTAGALFAASALIGIAAAQSNPSFVSVTTDNATTTPQAGAQNVTFGTVSLTGTQSGEFGNVSIASIPLTLTAGNGASAAQLTNCQVYNAAGTALTTGGNVISSGQSTNTITLDAPLMLSGGTSQSLTLRCSVASNVPSGGSFSFSAGTPVLSPSLFSTLTVTPRVQRGGDVLLATLQLNASRSPSNIQISSVPLLVTFGSGVDASMLSDCRVRPASNLSQAYNSGTNVISLVGGMNTVNLDTALTIPAGSTFSLGITCDIGSTFPTNGTVQLSVNPADLKATVAGTNTAVPAVRGFLLNSTNPGASSGTVTVAPTSIGPGPSIPGVPNTGLGDVGTLFVLALSGLLAVTGLFYLMRRRKV